jgi:hypothetical protein
MHACRKTASNLKAIARLPSTFDLTAAVQVVVLIAWGAGITSRALIAKSALAAEGSGEVTDAIAGAIAEETFIAATPIFTGGAGCAGGAKEVSLTAFA